MNVLVSLSLIQPYGCHNTINGLLVHELKEQVAALSEKLEAVCGGYLAMHVPNTVITAGGDNASIAMDHGQRGTAAESLSDSRNSFADKAALLKGAN